MSFIIDGTETAPQYLLYSNEARMKLPEELITATKGFFANLGMWVDGPEGITLGTLNLDAFDTLNLAIGGSMSNEWMKFGRISDYILGVPIEEKTPCSMKIHKLTNTDIAAMQAYFVGLDIPEGYIDFPIDYYLMLQKYVPTKNQSLEDEGYSQAIDTGDAILLRAMAIPRPPSPFPIPVLTP